MEGYKKALKPVMEKLNENGELLLAISKGVSKLNGQVSEVTGIENNTGGGITSRRSVLAV